MLNTPLGVRTFEGYERQTFNYAAKSLANYLLNRIGETKGGKPWNGVVIRGDSVFAKLPDPKQQLVAIHLAHKEVFDGINHNSDQMRNAAVECIWAWLYHVVRNEVQYALRTADGSSNREASIWAYNLWECTPAVYNDQLAASNTYYSLDLGFWEEIIDKLAAQSVFDNKHSSKYLPKRDTIIVNDLNVHEATTYFQQLAV